jgi:hypothetical protein
MQLDGIQANDESLSLEDRKQLIEGVVTFTNPGEIGDRLEGGCTLVGSPVVRRTP